MGEVGARAVGTNREGCERHDVWDADPESFEHLERRKQIFSALLEMLEHERLDDISPDDVCERCGVSRTTFYRCFRGVRDVGGWYQRYGANIGMLRIGWSLTCEQGHAVSLGLIARARVLFAQYHPVWNTDFSLSAVHDQVESMRGVLERARVSLGRTQDYVLEGVSCACHTTVSAWVTRGMDVPARELAATLASFYPPELRRVLDAPLAPTDMGGVLESLL